MPWKSVDDVEALEKDKFGHFLLVKQLIQRLSLAAWAKTSCTTTTQFPDLSFPPHFVVSNCNFISEEDHARYLLTMVDVARYLSPMVVTSVHQGPGGKTSFWAHSTVFGHWNLSSLEEER